MATKRIRICRRTKQNPKKETPKFIKAHEQSHQSFVAVLTEGGGAGKNQAQSQIEAHEIWPNQLRTKENYARAQVILAIKTCSYY